MMTTYELDAIELQLGLKLPEQFRKLMLDYPFPTNRFGHCQLSDNPDMLISMNLAFRQGEYGGANWPTERFTFGHDGAGNHFFVDVSCDDPPVFSIDHETHEITEESTDIPTWVAAWQKALG